MRNNIPADGPEVLVTLELDSSLGRVLATNEPANEALRQTIGRRVTDLLETLGIPGAPAVKLVALSRDQESGERFLRVFVNGQSCRYPNELLCSIHGYVNGIHPDLGAHPGKIRSWLNDLFDDNCEMADSGGDKPIQFLSLACLEIIKLMPAVLLGQAQADVYIDSLPLPTSRFPDLAWLRPILRKVLNLRISIADKQQVVKVLTEAQDRSPESIGEDLIAALCPHVVEIQLPWEYLKQLTTADTGDGLGMFSSLRDSLFEQLGLQYPPFRFVPVEDLKPNTVAFQINHLVTLPFVGLQRDQCLVNDTMERLRLMGVEGVPATTPASGYQNSLVDSKHKALLEAAGFTTWNQMGFLTLCFADALRKNSSCFVHNRSVLRQLDALGQVFPTVMKAARAKVPIEQITRVLRALVAEGISVRNLIQVLERLLDYVFIYKDFYRPGTIANGPPLDKTGRNEIPDLVSFIRAGMKRYISHKYAKGTKTLVVYLFHPEIERMLVWRGPQEPNDNEGVFLQEVEVDRILEAIGEEIAHLPPPLADQLPVLLTANGVRPILRELVRSEFPCMPVTCYDELSPDLNVQPVATISLR